jgi:ER-bound oxygenase mpaB/B'/Rubber oxygenase, catalytic domain
MSVPSHAELDAARHVGDPAADETVAALGRDVWIVNAALRHVHRNGEPLPDGIPSVVRSFFTEHVAIPRWFDEASARRAQRWASRNLLPITVALFCASLPTAYGAARGARVLAGTGRMQGARLDRRINETAQFVLDVVAEGGLAPGGSAIRAIQKVRLMHAAVRAHLVEKGLGDGEVPINQEDMLGTLCTFSIVVLRSLRLLGVPMEDRDAEDYYQLWRASGAMLGIHEEILPVDFPSACDATDRVAARQFASSEHGRALMAALLEAMEEHVPGLRFGPRYLVRYLVGEQLADLLGVPADDGFRTKVAVLRLLPRVPSLSSLATRLSSVIGRPLLEGIIAAKLDGAPPTFAMPFRA